MNPWDLSASDLLVWGIVLHLVADWPLQNDWMANNKANLRYPLAGIVHASIHAFLLAILFGYWPGVALGVAHLLIDTRVPVVWWSKLMRQTQPEGALIAVEQPNPLGRPQPTRLLYDVGLEVRFWTDQVFHIACVAVAALVVSS